MPGRVDTISRRRFLAGLGTAAPSLASLPQVFASYGPRHRAQIAITLDLEMSRQYPRRAMMEWDYQKGNLDQATKDYAVEAGKIVQELGGLIHYFCVGRVLEQPDVEWLKGLASDGHPIGNHTYDHVNVHATTLEKTQFRFRRAPWLVQGRTPAEVIRENIRLTTLGLKQRCGIEENGFRTPGGFRQGLNDREDLQKMLLDLNFTWCSSKTAGFKAPKPKQPVPEEVYTDIVRAQSECQPFVYPTGLIEIPMSPISDVNAFRTLFWKLEYFLKAIRMAVEWAIETGSVFDLLCHPSCMVIEDPGFETFKLICKLVEEAGDRAEIVGLDAIAKRVSVTG